METMRFSKDGKVYTWQVKYGHVLTTVRIGNKWVANPTVQMLLEDGYVIVPEPEPQPTPEPYVPMYAELVEQYICEHGYPTYGAELAAINNYSQDPNDPEYMAAYEAYQSVRKAAKEWANEQPHREQEQEQQEQEEDEI